MAEAPSASFILTQGDDRPGYSTTLQPNATSETTLRGRTLSGRFEAIPPFKSSEEHHNFHERNSTFAVGGAWVFCAECDNILQGTSSYNGNLLCQAFINPTRTLDWLIEQTIKLEKEPVLAQVEVSKHKEPKSPDLSAHQKPEKCPACGDVTLTESYDNLVAHLNQLGYSAALEYIDRRVLSELYAEEFRKRNNGGAWIGRFDMNGDRE